MTCAFCLAPLGSPHFEVRGKATCGNCFRRHVEEWFKKEKVT